MDWRDLVGWRHLKRERRELLTHHSERVEDLFEAFEQDGEDPRHLLNEALENLYGGSVLVLLPPELVASAVVASVEVLRTIPINDRRHRVSLCEPGRYQRHFAAYRILAYASNLSLPFSAADVALLFELALNSGNLDRSLKKVKIEFSPDWDHFAAAQLIDQILAETRVSLINVAVAAAEGLMSFEFSSDVAELLVRSRSRLERIKPASFETIETLERIDALLGRPLSRPDDTT